MPKEKKPMDRAAMKREIARCKRKIRALEKRIRAEDLAEELKNQLSIFDLLGEKK